MLPTFQLHQKPKTMFALIKYSDGKLCAPPKPLAGNQGTIISVEDLFYNMTVRRKALRSPAEEYQKISDVVGKYAIHNASVGFALKKSGDSNDIRTPIGSNPTDNIRIIYGSGIARELIEFDMENDQLKFKVKGFMTNVNYSTKKFQFLLFINHRLVDCQSLKKCIDTVYQTYLPKNSHPFVYLSMELDPNNVDVNVHPTKHEVHFLNETQIVETISTALEAKLLGSNNSRMFYTQAKLPSLHFETKENLRDKATKTESPKYTIRTDSNVQKLEKFFGTTVKKSDLKCHGKGADLDGNTMCVQGECSPVSRIGPQEKGNEPVIGSEKIGNKVTDTSMTEDEFNQRHEDFLKKQESFEEAILNETVDAEEKPKEIGTSKTKGDFEQETRPKLKATTSCPEEVLASQEAKRSQVPLSKHFIKKITRVETKLTSVLQLRKSIEDNCHRTLRETFAQHVFVGPISPKQALIQYGTQLLLCNTATILEELFYQLALYNFQNFDSYRFETPMTVEELALIGLDLPETGWTVEDGPKEQLARRVSDILIDKGQMLNEYFSMEIRHDGQLGTLPILLAGYIPDATRLPLYLIRLATDVNWETERACFDTFCRETAKFYAHVSSETDENGKDWKWVTEYLLYPAIKEYFIPPRSFTENGALLEIASLPNLYKVFERC
ncbi:DNA mismatch repair protein Mlh1 isoform X2 [Cylas formicarius]|uniref:DNA mismatch repair protein Mlh1 isoform X2 n=1 Tax=Cylas formicarius TaxID=197179 RepID=UPI0029586B00|nr:DNA mismatch repair protein Mlh1 isoform X2 [Cylas formicarius]